MATPKSYKAESFPLSKGMQGSNIMKLQQALGLEPDGKFWNGTETALSNAYGVSSCSKELFNKIMNSRDSNQNNKGMTLTEKAKKRLKIAALALGGAAIVGGIVYVMRNNSQTQTPQKALNGVRKKRTHKSKKSLPKSKSIKLR